MASKKFHSVLFFTNHRGVGLFGFALFADPCRTKRSSSYVILNKIRKIVDPYRTFGGSGFFGFDFVCLFDDLKMMTPLS